MQLKWNLQVCRAVCDFYNIELYDFLVTGDIVDQLEYTSVINVNKKLKNIDYILGLKRAHLSLGENILF